MLLPPPTSPCTLYFAKNNLICAENEMIFPLKAV